VGWWGGVENGDGGELDGAVWGAGWAGERGVEGGGLMVGRWGRGEVGKGVVRDGDFGGVWRWVGWWGANTGCVCGDAMMWKRWREVLGDEDICNEAWFCKFCKWAILNKLSRSSNNGTWQLRKD